MLFTVELMLPEGIKVRISLMTISTVEIFEEVRAWLSMLGFQSWRISITVTFTVPYVVAIMVCFMRSITFDVLGILDSAGEGCMIPFLAVLALRYARVHVLIPNCSYETTYIDVPINQSFCFVITLDIPNIDPNNNHVIFGRDFDNSRSRS